MEKANAYKIILNNNLNDEKLDLEIKNIVSYPQVMQKMGINAAKMAVKDVENKIYQEIKTLVK